MPGTVEKWYGEYREAERVGRVFKLASRRSTADRLGKDCVSRIVSAIGKAAGIKVNTDPKSREVKFASAHDLRRSFGERWASRVMPQVLMQLVRHESIETTMRFYVGRNAESTADVLWAAVSNKTSNNAPSTPSSPSDDSTQLDTATDFTKHPRRESNTEPTD